jgi:hypothetical protein
MRNRPQRNARQRCNLFHVRHEVNSPCLAKPCLRWSLCGINLQFEAGILELPAKLRGIWPIARVQSLHFVADPLFNSLAIIAMCLSAS